MSQVSVIVPVYNVEKYLPECLESIIHQSLEDIEIIVLNDGSTDGSLRICEKYADMDDRIRLYSHENMGLGPTRNKGILFSRGQYLAFVDSDDYIAKDGLEVLYNKAIQGDFDIVQAETILFADGQDGGVLRKSLACAKDICLTSQNMETFFTEHYFSRIYSHNAWDKIFKREFVKINNLLFGDNRKIFAEDNWFQLQALHCCPSIAYVDQVFYWYRQQNDSIMHKPKSNLISRHGKMISDYLELIRSSTNRLVEKKVCSIIAADIFTMIALDSKLVGRSKKDHLMLAQGISCEPDLLDSICDLKRLHSAEFYRSNPWRRWYLEVMGLLYSKGWYQIANRLVWLIYRKR